MAKTPYLGSNSLNREQLAGLKMGIFLFIEVFTPYLDGLMYLQHFVFSIVSEIFELQTSKTHKNLDLDKIRVGPIQNCQTNRFLTIWQNIIFGPKFLTQGNRNHKEQEFDGGFSSVKG